MTCFRDLLMGTIFSSNGTSSLDFVSFSLFLEGISPRGKILLSPFPQRVHISPFVVRSGSRVPLTPHPDLPGKRSAPPPFHPPSSWTHQCFCSLQILGFLGPFCQKITASLLQESPGLCSCFSGVVHLTFSHSLLGAKIAPCIPASWFLPSTLFPFQFLVWPDNGCEPSCSSLRPAAPGGSHLLIESACFSDFPLRCCSSLFSQGFSQIRKVFATNPPDGVSDFSLTFFD